jgi:hypothetical protein
MSDYPAQPRLKRFCLLWVIFTLRIFTRFNLLDMEGTTSARLEHLGRVGFS